MASNRSKDNPIYGSASPLPLSVLPTHEQVLKRCMDVKQELQQNSGKTRIPLTEILKPVVQEIESTWKKASLPTMNSKSTLRKLELYYQAGFKAPHTQDFKDFQSLKPKLFDICTCRCQRLKCRDVGCTNVCTEKEEGSEIGESEAGREKKDDRPNVYCSLVHLDCKCSVKVDKRELSFLFDQRKIKRKMLIGTVDQKVTATLSKVAERKANEEAQEEREVARRESLRRDQDEANAAFFAESNDQEPSTSSSKEDFSWEPETKKL